MPNPPTTITQDDHIVEQLAATLVEAHASIAQPDQHPGRRDEDYIKNLYRTYWNWLYHLLILKEDV